MYVNSLDVGEDVVHEELHSKDTQMTEQRATLTANNCAS